MGKVQLCSYERFEITHDGRGYEVTQEETRSVPCGKRAEFAVKDEDGNWSFACEGHRSCLPEGPAERIDGSGGIRRRK